MIGKTFGYANAADSNTVTRSYPGGGIHGAVLGTGSDGNVISLSTMVGFGSFGLNAIGAASNTVTQSYLWGGGNGAGLTDGANYNIVSFSTMIGNAGAGFYAYASASNTVRRATRGAACTEPW